MIANSDKEASRVGLWDKRYEGEYQRRMYADPRTAKMAAVYLRHPQINVIEDWGCGFGGFKQYIREGQEYIGVDGSKSKYVDKIVDLETYRSRVDAVHMRHILEHNPNWEVVLQNALASFKKRMVLTLVTPFVKKTQMLNEYPNFCGTDYTMVDIAFRLEDITQYFNHLLWHGIYNINTNSQYNCEHIFYLERV